MKAVLSIPAHWWQSPDYAPLRRPDFLSLLGGQITRGLQRCAFLFGELPAEFPVEINRLEDNVNPKLCPPVLAIEAYGTARGATQRDLEMAQANLRAALSETTLPVLIPDCQIRLDITLQSQVLLAA